MTLLPFAPALALGAAVSFLPFRRARWLGFAVCIAGLIGAPWLAAALPSLSFPLIALSCLRLLAPGVCLRVGRGPLTALVAAAAALYAATLGAVPFDLYTLGFQARPLVVALAGVGSILAATGERAALALLSGALLAYAAGLYANLWDALIDPLLALLALLALAARLFRRASPVKKAK